MQTRLQAITRHQSVRLMAMLPIVVAAALVAGCGDKGKSEGKASQAAARVNGEEITVHQINLLLERQNGLKPEQVDAARSQALEGLIDQQLAVAKAEEQKLDRDPTVVQQLDAIRRSLLARTYLEKAAAAAVGTPSPEDVRKYFDSKPALFSQRKVYALQEFTVAAPRDASKALIEKLDAAPSPQAFVELIKNSGFKVGANQVTQAAEGLPMMILDKLKDVPDGKAMFITGDDGFKALLVVQSKQQPVTFEQAKPAIEQYLTAERRREFAQKEMKNLRAAAKIEYIGKFAEKPASGAAPASAPAAAASTAAPAEAASGGLDANALNKGLSGLK
ncbi:EpsD family peptidyl-prolyl cis-trans isomerase [Aquabacterium sp.]|uniref:EpsD family peptidyl-prolyl cis-trans isomerase n=1 Tax=Aquabacterium sp. TaxID=1872578 RepID=UPI002E35573A|nr:EpsD family peptidyl-prolyl cis-trans isomerase [Aquabacterium sp.]HEX5310271.1 EpsD family peptidyl-prolyl cis-trans isomerase [Aquabacterium sp.]